MGLKSLPKEEILAVVQITVTARLVTIPYVQARLRCTYKCLPM